VPAVTGHTSLQAVHQLLAERLSGKNNKRIYEAGGGSATFIQPDIRAGAEVTVLDIDKTQLQNNTYANNKILGDVQEHRFPPNSFDLIVCYNVIEHLDAPPRALELFFHALAPGGLLFIGAPHPNSFTGWVTRLTPHWFHVAIYRIVLGRKLAGQPGHGPFRTVFHPVVAPPALMKYCRELGFNVIYFNEYSGDLLRQLNERRPLLGGLLDRSLGVMNALTLWRHDLKNGDFHIVLEKPIAAEEASPSILKQTAKHQSAARSG
jgi:SAM-dependent methyltransferase